MSRPGIIRRAVLRLLTPLLQGWYARWNGRERRIRTDGFDLLIPPGVFHPDLFLSTRLLAEQVRSLPLAGKTFLDLGTGSGRIALTAARAGAVVTACDINPDAVACAAHNAGRNGLHITTALSDQFDALPAHFDAIAINPPYYDRDPSTIGEHAFLAGEGLSYFQRLFPALAQRIRSGSEVYMVLSEDLDLARIWSIARTTGLVPAPARSARRGAETTTAFRLLPADGGGGSNHTRG